MGSNKFGADILDFDDTTGFPEVTVVELLVDGLSTRPRHPMARRLERFLQFLAGAVPTIGLGIWLYSIVANTFVGKLTSLFFSLLL